MAATAEADTKSEAKEKTNRVKSKYVVLQASEDQVTPIGQAEALNDLQAIGEVAASLNIEEGEFIAVPLRSWRVRRVSVRTRRSVQVK